MYKPTHEELISLGFVQEEIEYTCVYKAPGYAIRLGLFSILFYYDPGASRWMICPPDGWDDISIKSRDDLDALLRIFGE